MFTLNTSYNTTSTLESMDCVEKSTVHVSIQKGYDLPDIEKCINCCFPRKYHCPFCTPCYFKPSKPHRARAHLDDHRKRAIFVGEYTVHRCGLGCRDDQHYHCLYCNSTLIRRIDYIKHVKACYPGQHPPSISFVERTIKQPIKPRANLAALPVSRSPEMESKDESNNVYSNYGQSVGASGRCDAAIQTSAEKPKDCDEFYFMTLAKMFKKLSPPKKADVRLKIERLLFEAEFE